MPLEHRKSLPPHQVWESGENQSPGGFDSHQAGSLAQLPEHWILGDRGWGTGCNKISGSTISPLQRWGIYFLLQPLFCCNGVFWNHCGQGSDIPIPKRRIQFQQRIIPGVLVPISSTFLSQQGDGKPTIYVLNWKREKGRRQQFSFHETNVLQEWN